MYTIVYTNDDNTLVTCPWSFETREQAIDYLNECPDYLARMGFVIEMV